MMLIRVLLLLAVGLTQVGCDAEYGEGLFPFEVRDVNRVRERLIQEKRELLQIEDLKRGDGPVAAWGRRVSADIEVRYADGGGLIYQGPIRTYVGFKLTLYNGLSDDNLLSTAQPGIELGLNGMAVGGRRRITVDRKLVCNNLREDADPRIGCHLTTPDRNGHYVGVRKDTLVVEATLVESCIPMIFRAIELNGEYVILKQVRCRDSDTPQLDPNLPIWHVY